ncbi:hypothetical protein [Streptomyces sp. 840.1]|uniref:hypothetical protein n=1 Tax=Streptomyces sp. 840.1 TaxID=2485152 RepID=UPI0011CEB279|nr:hypothetical protein [Streptomyces sp. 840.1]
MTTGARRVPSSWARTRHSPPDALHDSVRCAALSAGTWIADGNDDREIAEAPPGGADLVIRLVLRCACACPARSTARG